jgi:hypothetical protein
VCSSHILGVVLLKPLGSGKGALNQILLHNPNLFAPISNAKGSEGRYSANEIYSFVQ